MYANGTTTYDTAAPAAGKGGIPTMVITERLATLRREMAQHGMNGYVVVTDDFHGSEYVGDFFKARAYLSGFTGSAGTLVILPERAALWTDGRYFLQAADQLAGSGIELMRMGQPGVPTIGAFLAEQLPEGGVLGFDGRTVSNGFAGTLRDALKDKNIRFAGDKDLVWLNIDGSIVCAKAHTLVIDDIVKHTPSAVYSDDGKVTGFTCSKCDAKLSYTKTLADALKSGKIYETVTIGGTDYYVMYAAAGTTGTTTNTNTSPKTFDAGIAMYVGMALTSVAGSAVVIGKKKEF